MIKNIIFDLGGVLIDWNPTYLFSKVFDLDSEMDFFLAEVCTPDWNEIQDGGRSLAEGTEILVKSKPQYEREIRMFYDRWEEMLGGPIQETVQIMLSLHARSDLNLYALTNWSAETWPLALREYDFLKKFKGIVVSGQEKIKKPDPDIYALIANRYKLAPSESVFIDDNLRNIKAARNFGFAGIHYTGPQQLIKELSNLSLT